MFRRGEVLRVGPIRIHHLKAQENLVTVIVDKKVSKLAVERNRVKRRVRAILMKHTLPGGKLIVRGFSGVEKLTFVEMRELLERGLMKLKN